MTAKQREPLWTGHKFVTCGCVSKQIVVYQPHQSWMGRRQGQCQWSHHLKKHWLLHLAHSGVGLPHSSSCDVAPQYKLLALLHLSSTLVVRALRMIQKPSEWFTRSDQTLSVGRAFSCESGVYCVLVGRRVDALEIGWSNVAFRWWSWCCVRACVRARVRACVRACVRARLCACLCACLCVCVCVCLCARLCVCLRVCLCVYSLCVCVSLCARARVRVHVHAPLFRSSLFGCPLSVSLLVTCQRHPWYFFLSSVFSCHSKRIAVAEVTCSSLESPWQVNYRMVSLHVDDGSDELSLAGDLYKPACVLRWQRSPRSIEANDRVNLMTGFSLRCCVSLASKPRVEQLLLLVLEAYYRPDFLFWTIN